MLGQPLGEDPDGAADLDRIMVPVADGSDYGGSLRNPANYNGIVSMKPTTGLLNDVTRLDIFAGQQAIISQAGPLARTVADAELALALASGVATKPVEVRGLRIGCYESLGTFAPAPALARATREAVERCERLRIAHR